MLSCRIFFKGAAHDQPGDLRLATLIKIERGITNEIIELIALAKERKLYLERGYPDLMKWLVKEYGYSHAAAYRRIQAAELKRSVPEITTMLEEGKVNLSTFAQVQTAIRAQERVSGEKVSTEKKAEVLKQIEQKTTLETEQVLVSFFPQIASTIHQERVTVISESTSRLAINLSNETLAEMERVKALLSHSHPNATNAEIIAYLIREIRLRKDPLLKENAKDQAVGVRESDTNISGMESKGSKCGPSSELSPLVPNAASSGPAESESASAARRIPVRPSVRRLVIQRANGCCEYRDPETGRVCGSRLRIEVDHHLPRALGGKNDISNLRCLCRKHNALMAEKMLGKDLANAWRLEVQSHHGRHLAAKFAMRPRYRMDT